ncbi:TPA: toll/interleukin-1 receptor domain-containing protein, partial [Streptococcus suis]
MGIVMRQYNNFYIKFQRQFKKAHGQVIETMPLEFSNKEYIERFKYMFPDKILLIERERNYWYGKRIIRKNLSKIRCKGMSLETDSFILSTSKHIRKIKRESLASNEEMVKKVNTARTISLEKLKAESLRRKRKLNYIQEVEPPYLRNYRNRFFKTHDLHERLEIIRELSKYDSKEVRKFFYA